MSGISCDDVLADLERYVDGELDHARSLMLSEHLRGCRPCLEHAEFRTRFKRVVRDKWSGQTPEELIERVARSITETSGGRDS
jgi:mycothiol system anti-sigma-R factor